MSAAPIRSIQDAHDAGWASGEHDRPTKALASRLGTLVAAVRETTQDSSSDGGLPPAA